MVFSNPDRPLCDSDVLAELWALEGRLDSMLEYHGFSAASIAQACGSQLSGRHLQQHLRRLVDLGAIAQIGGGTQTYSVTARAADRLRLGGRPVRAHLDMMRETICSRAQQRAWDTEKLRNNWPKVAAEFDASKWGVFGTAELSSPRGVI